MSFLDCINEAESEGTITGDQAERARGLYTTFLKQKYGKQANAEAEAGESTFDALQADIVQRKRRAVLQHQAQKDRLNEVLQYDVDHTGQVLGDIIDKGGRGLFKTIDYEARRKGILTRAHSKMADILTQMKRWGYIKKDIDYAAIAQEVYLATDAQAVMAEMGQTPPTTTIQDHVIMGKTFNPGKPQQYVDSFAIKRG